MNHLNKEPIISIRSQSSQQGANHFDKEPIISIRSRFYSARDPRSAQRSEHSAGTSLSQSQPQLQSRSQ
eukprot:1190291-Prorocentrum_minimum.AAC.3